MKYKVLRDCHFAHRYWEKDEIAEFTEGTVVPEHFESVDRVDRKTPVVVVPEENIPKTMSEINETNKKHAPKTGMAYDPNKEKTVEPIEPHKPAVTHKPSKSRGK